VSDGAADDERWHDGDVSLELQRFAARLTRTRSHEGLGPRCELLRFRGEDADRFAARRELSTTLAGRVGPRWECRELTDKDIPAGVTKGMRRNQKPFHLWNVERIEHDDSLKFDRIDGLIIGRAAALPEELRPPRKLKKATRVLREWLDDQAFQDVMLKMDKKRNAKLMIDKLPYGKVDDDAGESIVFQPGQALDERFAAFVRLPGGLPPRATRDLEDDAEEAPRLGPPPSFDFTQPADAEGRSPPLAGFDFSQPDDAEDEPKPPPFAGFDFTQPDEEP